METADFEAALKALREEYQANLPTKIGEIEAAWQRLRDGEWQAAQFDTFTRLAHSLAGSGATYGFTLVSQAARALELYCKELDASARIPPEQQSEIENLLARLQESLAPASAPQVSPLQPDSPPEEFDLGFAIGHRVLLYEPDTETAHDIEIQLGFFGYTVERLEHVREVTADTKQVAALILNWDAAQAEPGADLDVLRHFHHTNPTVPILFLSVHDDLTARLNAVHHCATAYLVKPISSSVLLETMDAQTGSRRKDPYRILIVEDDSALAKWVASVLKQAGMLTQVVTDPLQVMPPLVEFRPDLILSDMNMPNVSGLELAQILRQQEAYVAIPIVFLSGETNVDKQLSAMLHGGDDFLLKPIQPRHLVASVTSRVQRARALRNLAEHDSLTGLLNHTRFKEKLSIEIARAGRTQTSLAFAMLDLDRFKLVNDIYGHPTGDRVLKGFARLLRHRLRRSDILGRYGGEEFGVILPETNESAALQVMNEIRTSFAQLRQYSAGHEFAVTLSGGIAMLPPLIDAVELSEAADKALYQAKRGGRNQIVLADM